MPMKGMRQCQQHDGEAHVLAGGHGRAEQTVRHGSAAGSALTRGKALTPGALIPSNEEVV